MDFDVGGCALLSNRLVRNHANCSVSWRAKHPHSNSPRPTRIVLIRAVSTIDGAPITFNASLHGLAVYLDNFALVSLSKGDTQRSRRFVNALKSKGDLLFSVSNVVDLSGPRGRSLDLIRNLLDEIGPHWIPVELDPFEVVKRELNGVSPTMACLRTKRRMRRSQHSRIFKDSRGQIADAISIRERPAEVEDRGVPGHWEGDLLSGSRNSHIVTLVERHSRFAMLIKVPSKDTAVVVTALSRHIRKLPATLRRSLTWDRGLEMAKHKDFTVATDVQVYFCDPQSPWQRGTNENTNLLLRQYFPRGTDLSGYSQAQLDQVALRLNQRPRKTLGFQTPASKLQASVASTI
jgi:hypothetical protein